MGDQQSAQVDGGNEIGRNFCIDRGKITGAFAEVNCSLDAGIVDEDIEVAELGDASLGQCATRSWPCNVTDANSQRRHMFLCDKKVLPSATADDNRVFLSDKLRGQSKTNSCGAAGD